MAIVFAVFGLETSRYATDSSAFSSLPQALQTAMRHMMIHFVSPLRVFTSTTTAAGEPFYYGGTTYHIFDGAIDTNDIPTLENYWGSDFIKLFTINSDGSPGFTNSSGYVFKFNSLNDGILARYWHRPAGWSDPDTASWSPYVDLQKHHGVVITPDPQGTYSSRFNSFASLTGKTPTIASFFAHAYSNGVLQNWATTYTQYLNNINAVGALPLVKMTTKDWNLTTEAWFSAADILAGTHDSWFSSMASACINFGKPIIMSINHEMNGDWYPYSGPTFTTATGYATDWTVTNYVQCYQYIVDYMRSAGASNVEFSWGPTTKGRASPGIKNYWPGGDYVSWITPSMYNDSTMNDFTTLTRIYGRHPFLISEWATEDGREVWYSGTYPGDAEWVSLMMDNLLSTRVLKGQCYYHWDANSYLDRVAGQSDNYSAGVADSSVVAGPWQ